MYFQSDLDPSFLYSLSPGYDKLKLVGHQLSDSPYFAAVELVIDFQSRIREAMALCE